MGAAPARMRAHACMPPAAQPPTKAQPCELDLSMLLEQALRGAWEGAGEAVVALLVAHARARAGMHGAGPGAHLALPDVEEQRPLVADLNPAGAGAHEGRKHCERHVPLPHARQPTTRGVPCQQRRAPAGVPCLLSHLSCLWGCGGAGAAAVLRPHTHTHALAPGWLCPEGAWEV